MEEKQKPERAPEKEQLLSNSQSTKIGVPDAISKQQVENQQRSSAKTRKGVMDLTAMGCGRSQVKTYFAKGSKTCLEDGSVLLDLRVQV